MAKWMIDAGHGGHDSGVMAYQNKNSEKAMNLVVALELAKILKDHGQEVYLTRKDDRFLALKERADLANSKKVDYFISVHHNGANGQASGMEVFYSTKTDKKLAEMVLNVVADGMGQRKRKATNRLNSSGTDYYAVLRLTKMKAIITEFGFVDNPKDYALVDNNDKLRKQGALIAKALLQYAGKVYKGPSTDTSATVNKPKPQDNVAEKVENLLDLFEEKIEVVKAKGTTAKLITVANSRLGKNTYSQNQKLRTKVGEGYSDCSGFVQWAYLKAVGIDPGAFSGAKCLKGVRVTEMGKLDLSRLKPGDLLFYERDSAIKSGRPYGIGHVEMYIGDGKMIGHGSGKGPTIKPVTTNKFVMARRYFKEDGGGAIMAAKPVVKSKYFSDIPANHWSIPAFDKAKELGILSGTGSGKVGFSEDKATMVMMIMSMRKSILDEVEKKYGK